MVTELNLNKFLDDLLSSDEVDSCKKNKKNKNQVDFDNVFFDLFNKKNDPIILDEFKLISQDQNKKETSTHDLGFLTDADEAAPLDVESSLNQPQVEDLFDKKQLDSQKKLSAVFEKTEEKPINDQEVVLENKKNNVISKKTVEPLKTSHLKLDFLKKLVHEKNDLKKTNLFELKNDLISDSALKVQSFQDQNDSLKTSAPKENLVLLNHKNELHEKNLSLINSQILKLATRKGGECLLRLEPDNLGFLLVRVMTKDRVVNVEILASNEKSKTLIQDNVLDLKSKLDESNLILSQFDCDLLKTEKDFSKEKYGDPSVDLKNHFDYEKNMNLSKQLFESEFSYLEHQRNKNQNHQEDFSSEKKVESEKFNLVKNLNLFKIKNMNLSNLDIFV